MIEFSYAKSSDLKLINSLISEVFNIEDYIKNYSLMFHEDNVSNILIAKDENKVIATLPAVEFTYHKFIVRFIGGVVVCPKYRGNNIIDNLIKLSYQKKYDLILISGLRKVYLHNEFLQIDSFYEKVIKPKENQLIYINYAKNHSFEMYNLYNSKINCSFDQFVILIENLLNNKSRNISIKLLFFENELISFIVVDNSEDGELKLIDYAGLNLNIIGLIEQYLFDNKKDNLSFIVDYSRYEYGFKNSKIHYGYKFSNQSFNLPYIGIFYH